MLILQTNNGRLVIESDVDNVEVQVLKDGKDIGMQVDRGENQLTIRSGEYQLKITTPSDGVTIEPQAVRVQRGGQTIVRIRKESDDSQPLVARKDPKTKPKGPASQQPFAADPLMSAQLLLSKGPQFDNRSLGEWLRVAMQGDTVSSSTWTAMESLRDAYKQEDRRGAATQLFNLLERERSPQQMAKIGVSIVLVLGASITTEDIERVLAPIANASPKAIAAVANQPNVSRGRGNQVRFLWVDIRVAEMIAQLPKEKRTPTIQRLLNEGPSVMRRSCLAYFQRTVEPRFTEPTDVTAYYRPFAEALVKASLDESPEVRQMSWSLLKYHSTHLDSTRERAVAMLKDPDKSLAYDAALVLAKHWPKTDGLADFCMKRLDDNAVAMIESLRLLAAHQPRLAPMIIERYSVVAPPQNFWDGELIRVLISMKPPATESLRKLLEQLAQPTDQELAGEDSFDAARSASMSGMLSGNPAEWVALAVAADEGLLALYGKPMPKRYRGYTQEVWLARLLKIDPASARTLTDLRRVSEGLRATRTDEFELTIAESLLRRKDPVTSSISDRRSSSYARSVFDSIMKEVPVEALAKTLRKIWGEDNVPNEILLRSIKALEVHTDSHNVDQLWPGLLKLVKSNDEAVFQNAAVVAADLAADNEAMGDVGELIDVLFSMLDDPDRADDCSNLLVDLHIEKYKTFDEILATSNARLLGHLLLTSSTTEPQLLEILDSLDSVKERDRESLLLAGIKRLKDLSNTAEAVSRLRAMSVSGSPEVRSRATQVLSTLRPPPKRFDGKTIDEWFGLLSVELKFEARNSAISAISALAGYDDRANDAFAALLAAGEGVNLNATVSSSTKIIPPLAYGCVRIAAPQSLMMLEKVMAKDPAAPLPLAVLFFEREMSRSDEQGTPLGTTFAADPERFARIQQVLLKLCQHEHDHVRMRAVVALADPLSKEARSTLAELLNHKNPQLNLLCAKRLFEQNAPSPELVSWFGTHLSALANSKPSGMELNVPHAGRPQPVFPLQNWCLQNVDQLGAKGTPLAQVLQQIAARAERRSRLHRVSPDESNLFSQTDSNVVELRGEMEIQMMAKGALAAIGVEVQGDLQE